MRLFAVVLKSAFVWMPPPPLFPFLPSFSSRCVSCVSCCTSCLALYVRSVYRSCSGSVIFVLILLAFGRTTLRLVVIPLPNQVDRRALLDLSFRSIEIDDEVDLGRLAEKTEGYSGADLSVVGALCSPVTSPAFSPWYLCSLLAHLRH
jgi:AAA+ lid domain